MNAFPPMVEGGEDATHDSTRDEVHEPNVDAWLTLHGLDQGSASSIRRRALLVSSSSATLPLSESENQIRTSVVLFGLLGYWVGIWVFGLSVFLRGGPRATRIRAGLLSGRGENVCTTAESFPSHTRY